MMGCIIEVHVVSEPNGIHASNMKSAAWPHACPEHTEHNHILAVMMAGLACYRTVPY